MSFKSTLLVLFALCGVALAQRTPITDLPTTHIKVQINSGNPVFPFPQFLPYKNPSGTLGNLATKNPMGVTHAEMEQTIRDAYQITMNRVMKPGGGVGGTDYLYFVSDCNCTEGDGYGMLCAVSMADKVTFDGLWLYEHDTFMHKVKRYRDGQINDPTYDCSTLPGVYHQPTDNSATDGDVDIAFALFCAYKQWGDSMHINDADGKPILYKQAAIEILKGLTDTLIYNKNNLNYLCGDIGLDGYVKGGDSWQELTDWASDKTRSGLPRIAEFRGPQEEYFDYNAPAYFHEWSDFLSKEDPAGYAWNISQFKRGEASGDWLMGQILTDPNTAMIPYIGKVSLSATNKPTFAPFNAGEDFRLAWRTILNYVWHGNPTSSWDPTSHQPTSGTSNSFERDVALRYASFLSNPQGPPWNNPCIETKGTYPVSYWGPMVLLNRYTMYGKPAGTFFLNWIPGTGSISAVAAQNYSLMADLYRYSEIEWDVSVPGDGYMTSVPFYFHEWFRMLGLLVNTGNYQSPSEFKPTANTKVYMAINKTFAFEKDTVTYTIDYRNYGSLDATGTTIVDTLHNDFVFVSATGGGTYNATNHTVTWNIGTVPGFKSKYNEDNDPTKGQVELKVIVGSATQKQYRNSATISCSNGSGWTSNEFPNHKTAVMERNYLDIAKRALILKKTASASRIKPGTSVQFTVNFENTSEAGWINGGRPGVHFSFSQSAGTGTGPTNTMRFRLFHDAQEGYIDYGNYRVSYFLYDPVITGITSNGTDTAWVIQRSIIEGIDSLKLVHELITPGQDSLGKWNQRVIIQFSDPTDPKRVPLLSTIDHQLSEYRGMQGRIHKGGTSPLRLVWFLNNTKWANVNFSDDWSWDPNISQDDAGIYFPVTNDWTDLDKPDIPVNTWNPHACETSTRTVKNILVEEWDGYTWRKVAGNGPLPGRDAINVVIRDTVPQGMTFVSLDGKPSIGTTTVTGNVITWTIPKLQIKQGGTITYTAKADGTCPGAADLDVVDRAWISADKESPFADSSLISISCDSVPKPPTPDHLDIVLDTNSIDQKHDAQIESIDIDENTTNVKIYAAVRDKKGNFLSWANASWTSSNPAIGTVSLFDTLTGLITRINSGTITITVNQNGLKSDSITVYVAQLPPWPVITSTKMLDTNADVIPDLLTITLSDTFHLNQKLDSLVVNYLGKTYSIPVANTVLTGKSLTVPFVSLSGVDPQPSGFSNLIMTVNNARKTHSKVFDDGVCPAIKSCLLLDNNGAVSKDTLKLRFYEPVTIDNLTGATLLLIRNGTTDTIPLQVTNVNVTGGALSDSAVVTVTGAYRPQPGDLLRFVPGASGNTVADEAGNLPHLLNRSVVIRTKPPQIKSGWYTDKNGDGTVETVYLTFNKEVDPTDLNISLTWGGKIDTLKYPQFTSDPINKSTVVINLPDQFTMQFPFKTSGSMYLLVGFISIGGNPQPIPAADSAAPVLTSGLITPGVSFENVDNSGDTLRVAFSEDIKLAGAVNPFFIQRTGLPADTMDLKLLYTKNDSAVYLVSGYHGFLFPITGDSLWLRPGTVGDAVGGAWQNCPENHKVAITVKPPKMKWQILMGPNPVHIGNPGAKITISIKPLGKTRGTLSVKANISIYDALGNIMVDKAEFKNPTGLSPVFAWNGTNRNGRLVGSGTYFGIITFGDGTPAQNVKIGVRR